jgi:hypothetical protein
MEDDLDNLEPPRKRFKRADQQPVSVQSHESYYCIKNIPRDILSEILNYLDVRTIRSIILTCHYFKQSNLWAVITRLDALHPEPIHQIITSIDASKLTKLRIEVEYAEKKNCLAALLQFSNVVSLQMDVRGNMATTFIGSLLSRFPLLRELTTKSINPATLAYCRGEHLTRLDVASFYKEFDAGNITQFSRLEVMKIRFEYFTNADSITHMTCLTSLMLNCDKISDLDLKAICRHTQLKYFDITPGYHTSINLISALHNLTTWKCNYLQSQPDWTNILAPLTALQHIHIIKLAADTFPPQLRSTLTHLAYFRSNNQRHAFQLSSLQSLDITVPSDANTYVLFNELQQLTKLSLWPNEGKIEYPFWTALTNLSCLVLPYEIGEQFGSVTSQLMPSVQVIV